MHRDVADRLIESKRTRGRLEEAAIDHLDDTGSHARDFTSGQLSFAHEVHGQIALAMGVEPRSPFSDRRLIEFAVQMPVEMKLFAGWYKHLLRASAKDFLPEKVRWRRDVGSHPGWKFYEQMIAQTAREAGDGWNMQRHAGTLAQWIDATSVARAQERYRTSGDYGAGFSLFSISVLAQWLTGRNLKSSG
jgi:asparagine synthase (glutamine-hydrolysing)